VEFFKSTQRPLHGNLPIWKGWRVADFEASLVDECLAGDKRPILLDCAIDESLDVARVTGGLYYLSAGFLTVSGCDTSSQ
jgi:hypothetical protein